MTVVDLRAFFGIGDLERFFKRASSFQMEQVGRTGQRDMLVFTIIEIAKHESVSIGMWLDLPDFSDDEFLRVP